MPGNGFPRSRISLAMESFGSLKESKVKFLFSILNVQMFALKNALDGLASPSQLLFEVIFFWKNVKRTKINIQ